MPSGLHHRKDLASTAFYHHQTNAEAAVSPCSAAMSLATLQTMVDSLRVSPSNVQSSTHSSQKATSYGQRLLPVHKGLTSDSDPVSASTSDERLLDNKRWYYLTNSNASPSQQLNGTLQPLADSSVGSAMTSAQSSGTKPSLDDDQILYLIENKLKKFRVKMKALKEQGSPDASNGKASGSPQGSSPITPSASAAENLTVRTLRDEECSEGSGQNPGRMRLESAPALEGTPMERAPVPEGTRLERAPVPEGTPTERAPVPEGTRLERAPVPEGTRLERAPVPEGTRLERAPVPEGTRPEGAPVPEGTRPEGAPVPEGTPTERAPVPEGTPTERAPVPEGTPTERAPVPEGTPTERAPVPEGTRLERAPVPEGTRLERAPVPEGTRLERAPTDKHFTERDQIITALIHSNMEDKEKDDSTGLRAPFSSPPGELVTQNLDSTAHHTPPDHGHNGAANDHSTPKDVMKGVDAATVIADSTLSRSIQALALRTDDQQPFGTDSDNEASHTVETSKLSKSNSSAGLENLALSSFQIVNVNKVPDVTSSVADYQQVTAPEPQRKELTAERVEIGVQAGEGRIEMDNTDGSSIPGYPEFEDITEESTPNKPQMSTLTRSPKQLTNAKTSTNVTSEPAERPTPKRQEPEAPLRCSCPYLVETDDGFKTVPCPKCAQATPFPKREEQSEEESDSEEVILFVTDLVLEDEIIVLDSSDDEGAEDVSSAEQQDPDPIFRRVEEFETFDSFYQSKVGQLQKNLSNPLVATGAKLGAPAESEPSRRNLPKNLPVEKIDSEQVLPHCSSQKQWNAAEKDSEMAPAPKLVGIFEKFSPELMQTPHCNMNDSSDTDDSSDYPSHTQPNYLAVSDMVDAPSPHSYDYTGEDHEESLQASPEITQDTSDWFPALSPDSESEVEPAKPIESTERSETPFKKAKYKSRRIIESDSEPENDQGESETHFLSGLQGSEKSSPIPSDLDCDSDGDQVHYRRFSKTMSVTSETSTQPRKSCLKPQPSSSSTHLPKPRPEAHAQNVSSVSSKVNNVGQKMAFKRQKTKTDLKGDIQAKRKRTSLDTGKQRPEIMADQASGSSINAPNFSFILGGEQYRASSLPPPDHSRLASDSIRKTQPTPQGPPKSQDSLLSSNVNSYSTVKSTPAKQALVRGWSDSHISIRKERRRSHEADQSQNKRRRSHEAEFSRTVQNAKTKSPLKPRKRHNSQNLAPLMKKTKLQAKTLTNAVHHKESTTPSEVNVGERYKWKEKMPAKEHMDESSSQLESDCYS
ncbi:uncharacterized protein LOC110175768 isoform X1 [Boleophthalmus pectinirostris]|uniref:uncharacterized protein LOC110175768 isoform X1 n=1 Tax=Boleophthalmus pectinirostris TaxID=150288 RepID=UPI00242C7F59|nr:uncharacterized protein LOC110175768 isoform X1 [Boleophthalmus pectinirostris]